jgi:6-pyruvoyltetrahydropterin/6-carboxytetrahydropterin synthase
MENKIELRGGNNVEDKLSYDDKAIVEVTKEFTFDSAHYLKNYIGKCSNMHGHTYKLQVTFKGTCDDKGMLVDFNTMKKVVTEQILEELDHKDLTKVLAFNTTAENLSMYIYDKLLHYATFHLEQRVSVCSVKLWETPTSYAEYKGEML